MKGILSRIVNHITGGWIGGGEIGQCGSGRTEWRC